MTTLPKVFFPYSSPNKILLNKFVSAFQRHFTCNPLHDQIAADGLPTEVCLRWATECNIAIILLTPDVVINEDKFVRKYELPVLRKRYDNNELLTLHSVIFEACEVNELPAHYQTWLFQAYWGEYSKSMGPGAIHKKDKPISFESLHDDDINEYMKVLAKSVKTSYKAMLSKKKTKTNNIDKVTEKEEAENSKHDSNLDLLISQMIEKMQPLTQSMENSLRKVTNNEVWYELEITKPIYPNKPHSYIFCRKIIPICITCKEDYKNAEKREIAIQKLLTIVKLLKSCFEDPKNNLNSEIENFYDFLSVTYDQSSSRKFGVMNSVDNKLLKSLGLIIEKLELIKKDAFFFYESLTN